MSNLNELLQRLCDADIDFVVVGGFAGVLHGSTLVTRDLDVCTVLTGANVEKLRLETDAGAIDFLSSITGVGDFQRVRANAAGFELFGRKCRVMSLPDLVAAKRALGRDKDLLAARKLEAIAERLKSR